MALQDVTTIPLKERNRETGIPAVGAAPWGMHLCCFYDTKQDLIDILVPYFKAGLKSNEFCIWVTSEPLNENEAEEALRNAVPDFAQYLERGQIEIVPYDEWYLKDGVFNKQRVLNAWIDKLDRALARGYDGMRVTGDTSFIEGKYWRDWIDYEEEANSVIGNYRMLVICSYPSHECGATQITDVVSNHQATLIRRAGKWVLTESSERKRVKHDLSEREKELKCLYGITDIAEKPGITLDELYQEIVNLLPSSWQYPEITCARIAINGKKFKTENYRETEWQQSADIMAHGAKVGAVEVNYLEARTEIDEGPFLKEERLLIDAVAERLGDIAEHKRAEEELQLLSSITQQISDSIIVTDTNYEITYINKATEDLFGYNREELEGRTPDILNAEPSAERIQEEMRQNLSSGGVCVGSLLNRRKDGGTFVCEYKVSPLRDKEGRISANIGVQRDITERKRAKEEIKKFKLIADIADIADYGVAIRDPERIIVYVNESYARMHGYTTDELIGKHTSIVFSEEETKHVKRLINKQLRLGGFTNEEVGHKKKDGTVFPTLTTVTILRDGEGKLLFASGIVIDITERKQAEEELLLSREQLRNLSEYLQYVKEERKEPLTTLQGKFIKTGLEGFDDREVVELLLSLCPSERQRHIRERASKAFKNVRELLSASPQELRQAGLPPLAITYIRLLHDIPAEVLREKIIERSVYNSSQEIFDYLYYSMRDLKNEVFKVIYLNKRDQIIDVVDLFEGTLDSIPIHPREIVDSAIKHNASFLIFVHNHTSGDPSPSRTDKQLTRDLVFVGNVLQIRVLDHIVIGENRYFSFADDGLIQKYEDDFLNIRIRRI